MKWFINLVLTVAENIVCGLFAFLIFIILLILAIVVLVALKFWLLG